MSWSYAELSKKAKEVGGPEKLVDMIFAEGKSEGKNDMLPWVGITGVVCLGLGVASCQIINYFKDKAAKSKAELELAKRELIQGINDYDKNNEAILNDGNIEDEKVTDDNN